MQLEIQYRTEYRYEPPIRSAITALRLVPVSRPGVEVLEASIAVRPGWPGRSYVDGWGTRVDIVEAPSPHDHAVFEVSARVETYAVEGDLAPTALDGALFSGDSARAPRASVSSLGWSLGEGASWLAVESALSWMPQRFGYAVGRTDAGTTIEEFLELGAGVCQDFSHTFLAMLRGWGWCSRYVSGYFFNAPHEAGKIEADASHAWVEVYLPGRGWVGLDPTNGSYADDRYVPIGYGRDYDDVRPVRGVFMGAAKQAQSSHLRMQHEQ